MFHAEPTITKNDVLFKIPDRGFLVAGKSSDGGRGSWWKQTGNKNNNATAVIMLPATHVYSSQKEPQIQQQRLATDSKSSHSIPFPSQPIAQPENVRRLCTHFNQ